MRMNIMLEVLINIIVHKGNAGVFMINASYGNCLHNPLINNRATAIAYFSKS